MTFLNKERIIRRWKTASDFYQERDNRTMLEVRYLTRYAVHPVEIYIDPSEVSTKAVQQIALLACNLTARWARHIRVITPLNVRLAEGLNRGGHIFLEQRIAVEMASADPFGDFQIISYEERAQQSGFENPLRLFVGSWHKSSPSAPEFTEDDYIVSAYSWTVTGRRGNKRSKIDISGEFATVVAATGLAASLGVADLFKRAVGHKREYWMPDFTWNLWSHSFTNDLPEKIEIYPVDDSIDLGRTLLAGVGAIGSALVYLIDMMSLRGHITFLDRDRIETSNLNRSPLFTVEHALFEEYKTESAFRYLKRHKIELEVINGTWHESASRIITEPYDVWISFTNEDGAWAEMPFQMPPVVVQGTTTSGWGFGAGRHIPRRDDCTLCRMPRPEAVFRGPCAEGEIEEEVEAAPPARASLPFLSAASASLVLAELIKLNSPKIIHLPNDVSADLKTGLPAVVNLIRLANNNCRGCRATLSKFWEKRGGRSRFEIYSRAA
jgi:hypothetical protein